jgi:putative addiction module component (TIGR02574 family)
MSKLDLLDQALALSVEDQLDLAQRLWERASPPKGDFLSKELVDLLETRRQEALADPGGSVPWSEVKARLTQSK